MPLAVTAVPWWESRLHLSWFEVFRNAGCIIGEVPTRWPGRDVKLGQVLNKLNAKVRAQVRLRFQVPRLRASETVRIRNNTNPKRQATRTEIGSRNFPPGSSQTIFTSTAELDVSVSAQLAVKLIESPVLKSQTKT